MSRKDIYNLSFNSRKIQYNGSYKGKTGKYKQGGR